MSQDRRKKELTHWSIQITISRVSTVDPAVDQDGYRTHTRGKKDGKGKTE